MAVRQRVRLRPQGDERFIYVAARHWAALVIRALPPVALAIAGVLIVVARGFDREPDFLGRQAPLFDALNLSALGIAIFAAAFSIYTYLDWRNDHLILSNKRVVHEEITPWLAFRYETIPLDQIQNVNIRVANIFQYVLKYGRIEIQAAGPTAPIVFTRADCPGEMQRRILDEVQREKRVQEQTRLEETVRRRIHPDAPKPELPVQLPSHVALGVSHNLWETLFPIRPIQQGGTIIWHRHWIVLLKLLIAPTLSFVGWSLLTIALPQYDLLSPRATIITLGVLLLLIFVFFYWQYELWRNHVYILEPTRIVDVERLPFGLFEDRREATLGVIQNVNATSPNLAARLFGYGDVLIETAGQTGNFTFDHVPDPDAVQRIVFEYRDRFRWQQREREWASTLNIMDMYLAAGQRGNSPPP
jgi:uncharacterized membrane protein YdbT with pleckstrin-like domain